MLNKNQKLSNITSFSLPCTSKNLISAFSSIYSIVPYEATILDKIFLNFFTFFKSLFNVSETKLDYHYQKLNKQEALRVAERREI